MTLSAIRFPKKNLDRAICGLTHIQNMFQGNGKTFFIGIVAPDKLTAYQSFIRGFDREKINWTDEIARHTQLHVPRLDTALKKEITRGVRDVYLPNDTHWGSTGHRITAEVLYQYLREHRVFKP